ncbi:MAG: hypothetical protein KBS68_07675 [Clostridiales bacterium]|nr:hypothetical protein [Candidatus Crickella merdequi]
MEKANMYNETLYLGKTRTKNCINLFSLEIEDNGGFLWGLIGFLNFILGIFLYLLMKNSLPKNANALKYGVISSFAIVAVAALGYVFLIFSFR